MGMILGKSFASGKIKEYHAELLSPKWQAVVAEDAGWSKKPKWLRLEIDWFTICNVLNCNCEIALNLIAIVFKIDLSWV